MDTIKLLKLGWKAGLVSLVVLSIGFAGLILSSRSAAAVAPSLTLKYLGNNNDDPSDSWDHDVTLSQGQLLQMYAEIHNQQLGSTADNLKIKATLPSGSGTSTATTWADNASSVSDSVNITVNGGGQLQYVSGSTHVTWDVDGDGNFEFNGAQWADGIVSGGVELGDQKGCNEFIIQLSFLVKVVGPQASPSPTPTPTPSPSPEASPSASPSPAAGGQTQSQTQTQNVTQNNIQTQTVNVTTTGAVEGAKAPAKQPETGVGVLGMATMFGAAPLGFALSRYGRGRVITSKKAENLAELANGLIQSRRGQKS